MRDQGSQEMDRLMRQYFGDRYPGANVAVTVDSPMVRQFAIALASDSMNRGLGKGFKRCLDEALAYCQGFATKPILRAVTADNAHEFAPAPKRRGRKPKVVLGGNVVAFRRPEPPSEPAGERDEVCRRFARFVDRLEALTQREAAARAARRTLP